VTAQDAVLLIRANKMPRVYVHPSTPLDVNTAPRAELMLLRRIGPVLADRIIAARPFKTKEELITERSSPKAFTRRSEYTLPDHGFQ